MRKVLAKQTTSNSTFSRTIVWAYTIQFLIVRDMKFMFVHEDKSETRIRRQFKLLSTENNYTERLYVIRKN